MFRFVKVLFLLINLAMYALRIGNSAEYMMVSLLLGGADPSNTCLESKQKFLWLIRIMKLSIFKINLPNHQPLGTNSNGLFLGP